MIGNMIRICSLDFLNREVFETDVMTADGSVLFHSGEQITSDKLLKLYFKEIYINEPLAEKEVKINKINAAVLASVVDEASDHKIVSNIINELNNIMDVEKTVDVDTSEEKDSPESRASSGNSTIEQEKNVKGPKSAEINVDSDEDSDEEEENIGKGPRSVGSDKFKKDEKIDKLKSKNSVEVMEDESSQEKIEDVYLIFDEEQAKRIVKYSLKIGKMLKFSKEELKELEQVAYYCNIGVTEFKKSDVYRKGFRKRKALASYEKLLNEGAIPEKLTEMVKFCADSYESDSFELNSKIPYHHIVALADVYEELLSQNNSKEETLLKMLQMGGNQFNIFILHKFIKMMREAND